MSLDGFMTSAHTAARVTLTETLTCPSAAGILEAVARDFFDIDVTMDVLGMNQEEERTGKKEHVVFLIVQKPRRQVRGTDRQAPRQYIQTPRGCHSWNKLAQSVQRAESNGPYGYLRRVSQFQLY